MPLSKPKHFRMDTKNQFKKWHEKCHSSSAGGSKLLEPMDDPGVFSKNNSSNTAKPIHMAYSYKRRFVSCGPAQPPPKVLDVSKIINPSSPDTTQISNGARYSKEIKLGTIQAHTKPYVFFIIGPVEIPKTYSPTN